jgi:transcriptional regulator with XRE-family HTH domain
MKLKKYINNKKITYAEFAQRLGSISSVTLYRYATGSRVPDTDIVGRIKEATKGLVTSADFDHCRIARHDNRPKTQKGETRKKRVGSKLDVHVNAALEAEFTRYRQFYPHTTMPLVIALSEFGDRVCQYRERYYLDGRPISIPLLIEKANEKRASRGLVKILYPGCH